MFTKYSQPSILGTYGTIALFHLFEISVALVWVNVMCITTSRRLGQFTTFLFSASVTMEVPVSSVLGMGVITMSRASYQFMMDTYLSKKETFEIWGLFINSVT